MIKNPNELVVLIKKCEEEILEIESNKNLYPYRNNPMLIHQLEQKEIILKKRILGYIKHYKETTKNNYIDQKLFGNLITYIEKSYLKKYSI